MSQSANTTIGDLPPSSAVKGTMFSAAALPIIRAVGTDPVNDIRLTRGSETSALPRSSPKPCTILKTPGGIPDSWMRSASNEADKGDHSAGFKMTVLPAAKAGAHFQVESIKGAFHGVIMTAGPAGMRMTRFSVPFDDQTRSSCSIAISA